MKACTTFTATISLGLREGYDGKTHSLYEVEDICRQYCDEVGYGVTVTPTKFIYTNGEEDGCFIGLINYPRFPLMPGDILTHAFNIADRCMTTFHQHRVSVICGDTTYMLEAQ